MDERRVQPLSQTEMADGEGGVAAVTRSDTGASRPGRRGTENITALTKLYVWSLIFEPLLFFVLWDRLTAGISGNVSRLLQALVIVSLILKQVMRPSPLVMIRLSSKLYRNYAIFYFLAVAAGVIGAVTGAYHVSTSFAADGPSQTAFAGLLNSPAVRPLFEYLIIAYQLVYFIVLPRYMLKDEADVGYFFSCFKKMFVISLVLGMVDLAFAVAGGGLLPRHLADGVFVGPRFHGLAGEPRDAFVYMFLGLALLHLESYTRGKKLHKVFVAAIIAAAALTQSASGLIGIAIFIVLFSLDSLSTGMNPRRLILLVLVVAVVPCALYGAVISSERLLQYLDSASGLWSLLESRTALPYLMMVQSPNIYPLYDLTVKAREMDILPILIGSGGGAASAINNQYTSFASGELINPNSQFVRSVFEFGLIGTFFFIRSFVYPIKQLTKGMARRQRSTFILLSLLLMGCFLGQRSAAPFIYLGLFYAVFAPRNGVVRDRNGRFVASRMAASQESIA